MVEKISGRTQLTNEQKKDKAWVKASVTIRKGNVYKLDSIGDGLAYELGLIVPKQSVKSVLFRGDNADKMMN